MPRAARTFRRRDADATRRALRQAAAELFASRGYDGTRTQMITERAEVNKALISYYFGGKKGLYTAVILEALEAAGPMLQRVRDSRRSPDERLGLFIEEFVRFMHEYPYFPFIMVREQIAGAPHLDRAVARRFFGFFACVRDILEDGMRRGVFRRVDPHTTHLSLVGSLVFHFVTGPARTSYAVRGILPAPSPASRAYTRHVRETTLRGLRRGEPPAKPRPRRKS